MNNKPNKEYRSADIAAAESDESQLLVEGYAAVLEQPTVIGIKNGITYYEIIDRNAFAGADLSDVPFKYNHGDACLVLARTRNKTLTLNIDNKGLFMQANLADTQDGRDLYKLIQRRDIDKMSFGFSIVKDSLIYDPITYTFRVMQIAKVWDVSAVPTPAYYGTNIDIADTGSVQERNFCERSYLFAQIETKEHLEQEAHRKRLYLMTF